MLLAIHLPEAVRVQQEFLDTQSFDGATGEELLHAVDLCALVSGLRPPWP